MRSVQGALRALIRRGRKDPDHVSGAVRWLGLAVDDAELFATIREVMAGVGEDGVAVAFREAITGGSIDAECLSESRYCRDILSALVWVLENGRRSRALVAAQTIAALGLERGLQPLLRARQKTLPLTPKRYRLNVAIWALESRFRLPRPSRPNRAWKLLPRGSNS